MNRHNAPPVVYPLTRSSFLGGLLLGFWLASFISVLLWWHLARQLDWGMALAFFAVGAAGISTRTSWKNLPSGQLVWDGEIWRWESSSYQTGIAEHRLSVIVDFQRHLLLRLENQARANLWLWAEQSAMPERWLDLRRAVYSPQKLSAGLTQHDFFPVEPPILLPSTVAVSTVMQHVNVPRAEP